MGEQYRLASPASFVTADDPPMFFFHGENDDLVPISQPEGMCQIMRQASVPVELYVVPSVGHIAAAMDPTAVDKCIVFLATQLQPRVRRENPPRESTQRQPRVSALPPSPVPSLAEHQEGS